MSRIRGDPSQDTPLVRREQVPRTKHPVQDGQDHYEDGGEVSDRSDETDDSSERRHQIAAMVKEDMIKLERIFHEKGMRYRLVDRIGEGM